MNKTLPKGWVAIRLEEIAAINPRHPADLPDALPISFVPMPAISESNWRLVASNERAYGQVRTGYTHFAEGDVLFAKITPCMENGKAAVATGLINGLGCGTTEVHVIRLHGGIDPKLVYHFVHQTSFRREATQNFTGTAGQLRVPVSFLRDYEVPVPPHAEQRRIVAKLEELLAQVDASTARLAKVPKILKRFRQSILAAACSGRLTADWRNNHQSVKGVEAIIEAIRQRREAEIKTAAQEKRFRQIFDTPEDNDSSELPDTWRFTRLHKLATSFDYGTSAKSEKSGTVPVLRMGNIQDGKLDWSDLAYTSDKNEIESYSLQPGTVLFNRTNSPELVGKTTIYRGERPAIFAGYLIRVNAVPELDPEYLNICLNTNYAKDFCAQVKTDGVSQSNINAQKLGDFEVPFCPPVEQREIVRRVEELFALAERLETRYTKGKAHATNLTQAILAKAFRGELVVTEAELAAAEGRQFESAEMLVERICRDREGKEKSAVTASRRPRKGLAAKA
jgi:type I restriction enzyme S subunit